MPFERFHSEQESCSVIIKLRYLMSMRSGEKTRVGLVVVALQLILFKSPSASDMAIDNSSFFVVVNKVER